MGSGGGQYRGGSFFFLLNINDFWVMILSILNPFALVVAPDIFSPKICELFLISFVAMVWQRVLHSGQQSCNLLWQVFFFALLLPSSCCFFGPVSMTFLFFYRSSPQRRTKMRTKNGKKKKEMAEKDLEVARHLLFLHFPQWGERLACTKNEY